MNNLFLTVGSFLPIVARRGKRVTERTLNRIFTLFSRELYQNSDYSNIRKHYKKLISSTLLNSHDLTKEIDNMIEKIIINDIKNVGLDTEVGQDLAFNHAIIFLRSFYSFLRSNYLFNTITTNKLEEFNRKSIGNKVDDIILKKNGKIDCNNPGCCCRHFALLFKHFFDELENSGLNISNYLFIEKTNGLNHVGLIVTFKGNNYLVDTSVEKVIQPMVDLGSDYKERMSKLINLCKDDINDNIELSVNQYKGSNEEYHKVIIKNTNGLFSVLSEVPESCGSIVRNPMNRNLCDIFLGINFRFFNDGILVSNNIFYHFYPLFSEKELNKINDDQIISELLKRISYKTNKLSKKGQHKPIKVFGYEKRYLLKNLMYFSDKIDYSSLRRILLNDSNS